MAGDDEEDASKPRITSVRGRQTENLERGLPRVSSITLAGIDGSMIEASLEPFPADAELATARLRAPIAPGVFDACPICVADTSDTAEHVPPKAFGGRVMTKTCTRCNNNLGSRTEAAMQDWFDGAVRIYYTVGGSPEPFGHDRVFHLTTSDGKFALLAEKASVGLEGFDGRFRPGVEVTAHMSEPRPAEFKTGFLKSAFLAASLALGGVPQVQSAIEIRAELLAARDARRRDVVLGTHAAALGVYRTGQPSTGPPLAVFESAAAPRGFLISLAGSVLVDWPFPEVGPTATGDLR